MHYCNWTVYPCQACSHSVFLIVDKIEQNTVIYIWPFILIHIFCDQGPTFVNLALK